MAVCLCIFPAVAQNKVNSAGSKRAKPAATAYLAEENPAVWREFDSVRHGFWITFPNGAKSVDLGKSEQFSSYTIATEKALYSVAVKSVLVSMNNRELSDLFDNMVEETENESTRLLGEKNVYFNGALGREVVYEEGDRLVFGRFFILESKLFMLTINLERKNYNRNFDRWVNKFFDSFGVKLNTKMDA